jgi:hypothetical protein
MLLLPRPEILPKSLDMQCLKLILQATSAHYILSDVKPILVVVAGMQDLQASPPILWDMWVSSCWVLHVQQVALSVIWNDDLE